MPAKDKQENPGQHGRDNAAEKQARNDARRAEFPPPEGVPVVPEDPQEVDAPTYRHLEAERNDGPTLAEQNVTDVVEGDGNG